MSHSEIASMIIDEITDIIQDIPYVYKLYEDYNDKKRQYDEQVVDVEGNETNSDIIGSKEKMVSQAQVDPVNTKLIRRLPSSYREAYKHVLAQETAAPIDPEFIENNKFKYLFVGDPTQDPDNQFCNCCNFGPSTANECHYLGPCNCCNKTAIKAAMSFTSFFTNIYNLALSQAGNIGKFVMGILGSVILWMCFWKFCKPIPPKIVGSFPPILKLEKSIHQPPGSNFDIFV